MEVDGPLPNPTGLPEWLLVLLDRKQRTFEETVEEEKRRRPENSAFLDRLSSLHEKKLYHELTDALSRYLNCFSFCDSAIPPSWRAGAASGSEEESASEISVPQIEACSEEAAQWRVSFFLGAVLPLRRHLDRLRVALMLRDICRWLRKLNSGLRREVCKRKSSEVSASRVRTGVLSAAPASACFLIQFVGGGKVASSAEGGVSSASFRALDSEVQFALPGGDAFAELTTKPDSAPALLLASIYAFHKAREGKPHEAEAAMEEAASVLAKAVGFDPVVRAALHRAQAEVALVRGKDAVCYRETLFFLAYTPAGKNCISPSSMTRRPTLQLLCVGAASECAVSLDPAERLHVSLQAAKAALVAEGVFNYGELLQQGTVVAALRESQEHAWLFTLLQAFSVGCIDTVFKILQENSSQLETVGLAPYVQRLREKAAVCGLVRLAFSCSTAGIASSSSSSFAAPSSVSSSSFSSASGRLGGEASRRIPYVSIAAACRVPVEGVEKLVISAIARNLMRGKLDDVAQVLVVEWVRPVLLSDGESLRALQNRLCRWAASVAEVQKALRVQANELLGA